MAGQKEIRIVVKLVRAANETVRSFVDGDDAF
jgi:hypothetical protein